MTVLVDAVYLLLGLAYLPIAVYNALVLGKNRRGWSERLGCVPRRDAGKRIWIHAVSLGEINATSKLSAALRERLPDHELVFSCTTDTGHARAVQLYGASNVFRFPLDFSLVVAQVLRRVAPTMIVLVELEVWYNLVRMARRRGIPVAVVNGRLTERSAHRFRRLGRPVRTMFADLAWVGAQDETIAARFRRLGARSERVEITSSLKWDSALLADRVDGDEALAHALGLGSSRPLWVCGSTGPGEEEQILEAFRKIVGPSDEGPRLCIVPRKPERFGEVAALIERAGFKCVRRSQRPDGTRAEIGDSATIILGDTMGELRKFYSLARVIFVGRSLVLLGGSDPMEAAALRKPVIVGPHMENFQEAVAGLQAADAICIVSDPQALGDCVTRLLADDALAASLGARAQQLVRQRQGATARTVEGLLRILPRDNLADGKSARARDQNHSLRRNVRAN